MQLRIIILEGLFFMSMFASAQVETEERWLDERAQEEVLIDSSDISLLFKSTENGVHIRWAPRNAETWLLGNEHGYVLEKVRITGSESDAYAPVRSEVFKPLPLAEWEPFTDENTPYRAAAAMAIHGESQVESQGFVQEAEELNNRYGFAILSADLDPVAAQASGLSYMDGDVEDKGFYYYRITVNTPGIDTIYSSFVLEEPSELGGPVMLEPISQVGAISVKWERPVIGDAFSAYYIERSSGGGAFARVNDLPYLDISTEIMERDFISYQDSVDLSGVDYTYRVIGLDPFGDESQPSAEVTAQSLAIAYAAAPSQPVIEEDEQGRFLLKWDWAGETPVQGYNVYYSLNVDGPFDRLNEGILPPSSRDFVHAQPDTRETNYYYIAAVDANGTESPSLLAFAFTQDEIPPAPPTALTGQINQDGKLIVRWEAPADKDIRGYQVFYSNSLQATFAVKPGDYFENTFFVDSITLETLTEEIYYYVQAVDWSYNQSDPSEILTLKKPDIIAPDASIFSEYNVTEEGIKFRWIASTSDDVAEIKLYRSSPGMDRQEVSEFNQNVSTFMDVNVEEGVQYTYELVTLDDDGNETVSPKVLTLEALKSFFISDVTGFVYECDKEQCTISWNYENAADYDFILYRAVDEGSFSTLVRLNGETQYVDKTIDRKKDYRYAVKAKAKDGRESKMMEM